VMPLWVHRTLVQAARNGTNTHTVNFTPAAVGSLLIAIAEGPVTSTTPTGWTLRSSAINNTGLYLWSKEATAGESSFVTTHNAPNYPVAFLVYEFSASSEFVDAVSQTGGGESDPNVTLSGLTGTNLVFGVVARGVGGTDIVSSSVSWTASPTNPTEDSDLFVPFSTTDGYILSTAYIEDYTGSSFTPTGAISALGSGATKEEITFALSVTAEDPPTRTMRVGTSSIDAFRAGGTAVDKIYMGTSLVWELT
jgi:hypothetical protein